MVGPTAKLFKTTTTTATTTTATTTTKTITTTVINKRSIANVAYILSVMNMQQIQQQIRNVVCGNDVTRRNQHAFSIRFSDSRKVT